MKARRPVTWGLDLNHSADSEHVRKIAGSCRYLVVSGELDPWPVIERKGDGQAFYMTYHTINSARLGIERASVSVLPELRAYDLFKSALL